MDSFSSQADGGDVTQHTHVRPRPQSPGLPGQAWQGLRGSGLSLAEAGLVPGWGHQVPARGKGWTLRASAKPSVTLGCEVQPRPAQGKAASGQLHRDWLSPEAAGCNRQDSPGVRHPHPELLCLRALALPSGNWAGSSSTKENPSSAASHSGVMERVSAACVAERHLVLLALRPPSRRAELNPCWAQPSSPALPDQDTLLLAIVHMWGSHVKERPGWLLPTALVPACRKEAALPHRPPPQRRGPMGWEAQKVDR